MKEPPDATAAERESFVGPLLQTNSNYNLVQGQIGINIVPMLAVCEGTIIVILSGTRLTSTGFCYDHIYTPAGTYTTA